MVSAEKKELSILGKDFDVAADVSELLGHGDTAFLCLVLLSMLLLYQTGSTIIWTLMPGGGFLRVINGTFNTA